MKLTPQERLIFWNLFEIRRRLEPDEADYWEKMSEIVSDGYEILYDDLPRLSDPMPEERGRFVFDVLDMYRSLDNYLRKHPDDAEVRDHPWATFRGFDGNHETDLMGFCRFLIHKEGKWAEQLPSAKKNDDFNWASPEKMDTRFTLL